MDKNEHAPLYTTTTTKGVMDSKKNPTRTESGAVAKNGYFAWVAGASNAFPAPSPAWGATREEAKERLLQRGPIYPGQYLEIATWGQAPQLVHWDSAEADAHEANCGLRVPHTPGPECQEPRP